jgi:hypothetical protein
MKANESGMVGSITTPECFRAQATGTGNTLERSEMTGRLRSQRVIDCAPPGQRRNARANGYPPPMNMDLPKY